MFPCGLGLNFVCLFLLMLLKENTAIVLKQQSFARFAEFFYKSRVSFVRRRSHEAALLRMNSENRSVASPIKYEFFFHMKDFTATSYLDHPSL